MGRVVIPFNFEKFLAPVVKSNILQRLIIFSLFDLFKHALDCSRISFCSGQGVA